MITGRANLTQTGTSDMSIELLDSTRSGVDRMSGSKLFKVSSRLKACMRPDFATRPDQRICRVGRGPSPGAAFALLAILAIVGPTALAQTQDPIQPEPAQPASRQSEGPLDVKA